MITRSYRRWLGRSQVAAQLLQTLEPRVLLTGVYANADVAGTWHLDTTNGYGTVTLDDSGHITGGVIHNDDSSDNDPTGATYVLSSSGALSITTPDGTDTGALAATRDIVALSQTDSNSSPIVLVNTRGKNLSNLDMRGTWTLEFNGENPGSNGKGSFIFDGNGNLTGGSIVNGNRTQPATGTYSVDADGTLHLSVSNGTQSPLTLLGTINGSKDFAVMRAPAGEHTDLITIVRSSGTYTKSDLAGTWAISGVHTTGSVTVDATGKITAGSVTRTDGTFTISGSAAITSKGAFTFNVTVADSQNTHVVFSGAMNAGRNALIMNIVSTGSSENLTILINSANHAPTLKTVATMGTAVDTLPFTITYDQLLAASNAADLDGDPISFTITAVPAGTLAIDGNTVTVFNNTVSSGHTLTWTPAANANGTVTAFAVVASDGTAATATPVAVKIKSVPFPTVTITATKASVNEGGAGASGATSFIVARTNGDKTQPLTVHYTIAGTAVDGTNYDTASTLTGTVVIPANKPNVTIPIQTVDDGVGTGNLTIQLAVSPDASYATSSKSTATVTVKDAAPTITVAAARPTASEANNSSTGQFTITRTGDTTQSLPVFFTLGGTATRGPDYFLSGSGGSSVTIAAGAKTATFSVVANNNHVVDVPNLNVLLTLDPDPTYQVSLLKPTATITILEA